MKITVSLPDWTGLWDCPRAWPGHRLIEMDVNVALSSSEVLSLSLCVWTPRNTPVVFSVPSQHSSSIHKELWANATWHKRKPPVLFLMQKNSFIITGIKNEFKPGTWDVKRNSESWVRASRLALGLFQFRFDRLNEKRDILHLSTFKIISSKFQQLLC